MTRKFALFDGGELRPSTREQRDVPIAPAHEPLPSPTPGRYRNSSCIAPQFTKRAEPSDREGDHPREPLDPTENPTGGATARKRRDK